MNLEISWPLLAEKICRDLFVHAYGDPIMEKLIKINGPIISKFLNFLLFIFLESFDTNSHYPCLKNDTQMVRLKHWIPAALMASRNSAPKIQYIDQHYSSIDSESIFPNFVSVNFKWALFRKLIRHALSMHTQKI